MPKHLTASSVTVVLAVAALSAVTLTACGTSESAAPKTTVAQPITVTDARGKTVTFDGPATRVGGTEWNVVEYAVSLGVQPVGVSDIAGFRTWDDAVTLDGTAKDLGTRGEPSIDTVAALGLDVLFVTDELAGDAMAQIEKATKVVVVPGGDARDPVGAMWRNVDLVAKVLGKQEAAAGLRTEYGAKVSETKSAVEASTLGASPVAFSDAYEAGGALSIRPYGEGSLVGGVLKQAGIANAWSTIDDLKTDPAYGLGQTDLEGLTRLPADTHYWYVTNSSEADPYTTTLKTNAVWTGLPFTRAGRVTPLPEKIWMFGGPRSMMQVLDAAKSAVA